MPFKSLKQSKKCFATKGFGGRVNCYEFAVKTNYGKIPNKVKSKKK